MKAATCLLCCLMLLPGSWTYAENTQTGNPSYTILHFTDEDGLPQNSVKDIAQDKNGFLWLATENGLTRFDGRQFLNFNPANVPVIGGRTLFIYPTADRKGLLALMEKGEILEVHNGRAQLANEHKNDFGYLRDRKSKDTFFMAGLPDATLESRDLNHFFFPAETNAWFYAYKDTVRFVKNGREQYRFIIPRLACWRLFISQGKLCYYNGEEGRFIIFNREKAQVADVNGDLSRFPDLLKKGQHPDLFWNVAEDQVFLYSKEQCFRLQVAGDNKMNSELLLEDFDFPTNGIGALYYDKNNRRLFLGSYTKGLYVAQRKQFHTLKAGGEANEVYYAQAPYGVNGVLAAAGVAFDSTGARNLPLLRKINVALDNYSVSIDSSGYYWIKVLNRLYRLNSSLTKILWQKDLKEGISQLYVDKSGLLWVGGMEKGVYTLDTRQEAPQLQLYTSAIVDPTYIAEEDPGAYWFGTTQGLYRLDISSRRVDSFPALAGKYIRSIYIPVKGEVWVTTYNDGIFLYRKGRLTELPADRRQYLATAHCILKDAADYLWVTTNKGLFRFSRKDALLYADGLQQSLFYFYFGKKQGFNTNEFNGGCEPCALQWENGAMSLPSLDGIIYFKPAAIYTELPGNGIFIDQAEVDTRMMLVTDTVLLPHNFQQLKLYISSPYFGDPGNLQMYYSLNAEGEEPDTLWLPLNDRQVVEFSSLSSGVYKLHIRKVNGFGRDNTEERMFTIRVQKAYYETTWFRLLAAGLLILLISLFTRLRVQNIKKKNRQLEMRVSARTEELNDTLNTLQLSEEQLRKQAFMQQRLLTAISHDIKTPLEFLIVVIGRGYRQQVEIKGEERDMAYESLRRMFHLVENLVNYMRSQFLLGDPTHEVVDVYQLMEEKSALFRPVSQEKGVAIFNETLPGMHIQTDVQLLAVIVHNLLDNAVKYTKSGSILVKVFPGEMGVHIQFTDTGAGMPAALAGWMNNYGRKGHVIQALPAMHTGLGLLIVMELLQLIKGSIEVSSNGSPGTTIVLTLPALS